MLWGTSPGLLMGFLGYLLLVQVWLCWELGDQREELAFSLLMMKDKNDREKLSAQAFFLSKAAPHSPPAAPVPEPATLATF